MNKLIVLALMMSSAAYSDPKIYKLDLSYEKIMDNQDPMVPDIPKEAWGDSVHITMGVQAGRFYLEADPNFQSAYAKVTTVALEFHTGFELTSWLDLDYHHISRHSSDRINAYDKYDWKGNYPLVNTIGAVIHFVPNSRRQDK